MKNLLLIFAMQFIGGAVFSQTTNTESGSEPTKIIVAKKSSVEKAEFPGGKDSLAHYLSVNLSYPKKARKRKIEGTCYLIFTVTDFGNILNVQVLEGIPNCPECDAEAIRVVEGMSQWIPARLDDEMVYSKAVLPITFKL